MKIEKDFKLTISHKFINGDIASVSFGTACAVESILDNAPEEELTKFNKQLAKKVRNATMQDLENACKQDKLIKAIYRSSKEALKKEKMAKEAEEVLEDA